MPRAEPSRAEGPAGEKGRGRTRSGRPRPEYSDEGIVLRTYRLGESDKILRVLTREHGKVSAVGKGVRRTASRFGARLEPLTHARLFLHRGRTLDTVKQVEVVSSFQEVRDDLDLFVKGQAMAELADSIAVEEEPDATLFELLLLGLQLLREMPDRAGLTLSHYEFKVMGAEGFELMVSSCAACGGALGEGAAFSLRLGGLVCAACRSGGAAGVGKVVTVSPACVRLLAWMGSARLGDRPGADEEAAAAQAARLMGMVLEHWMEREFRSHRVARAIPGGPGTP